MFVHHPKLITFRAFAVAACLVLLAGCLPKVNNPAAPIPSNLAATAGDGVVTLTWTASTGATGYNVKRGTTSGGPYTLLGSPSSPGYTDSTVTDGTTYYYVVSSLNAAGESANSPEASATPKAPSTPPAAPTNLAATAGDSTVALTWTASTGAKSYYVKRSTTSGGPYTQIAAPTSTSYTDTSLTNGTTYYYVVSAINGAGESANSAQVSSSPSPPPPTTFGTWTNVTPANADLVTAFPCGNFGATSIRVDPTRASDLYTEFNCQGIWKSTDYGQSWTGPINTGTNGAAVGDCSGGVTVAPPNGSATVPVVYESCFRGNGYGFWKSVDGGVNWTHYVIAPTPARQDYFPPVLDPYDANHLIMAGHEMDSYVESVDGGQNWTAIPIADGMKQDAGGNTANGSLFFINTGTAATTRGNWIWIGGQSGGVYGTWRTSNAGTAWVKVDKNEGGASQQIYQPDNSGVVYMAGIDSDSGQGVLRSTDYGQTWTHVGLGIREGLVFGTSKNVYAMFGFPNFDPAFAVASQPGTGTWVSPGTPAKLTTGPSQVAVTNDGTHNIFLGGMFNLGVWRYVEP